MLGPDGGFNGSVISFFFSFHLLLSFLFQLAGNLDADAKLRAGGDRFFGEAIEFPLLFFPNLSSHIFFCWFFIGYFGQTRTRTRTFGYPKCRVLIFQSKFRVVFLKTRISENPKYPTRIFRVTRTPSHSAGSEVSQWRRTAGAAAVRHRTEDTAASVSGHAAWVTPCPSSSSRRRCRG